MPSMSGMARIAVYLNEEITMRTATLKSGMMGMLVLALAACGTPMQNSSYGSAPASTASASNVSGTGTVQSIDRVPRQYSGVGGVGLGTIAGAVVGGVLGNQVGSGGGRTAATLAGAAGGALAGNQMQKNMNGGNSNDVYRVSIRMDSGMATTLIQQDPPNLRVGDRVRVENGVVVERAPG